MDAKDSLALVAPAKVSFNPRARDGREILRNVIIQKYSVSIHAPVMDANDDPLLNKLLGKFQSTRP